MFIILEETTQAFTEISHVRYRLGDPGSKVSRTRKPRL